MAAQKNLGFKSPDSKNSSLEKLGTKLSLTPAFWAALGIFLLSFATTLISWQVAKGFLNPTYVLAFGTVLSFTLFWVMYVFAGSKSKILNSLTLYQQATELDKTRFKILSVLQESTSLDERLKTVVEKGLLVFNADVGIICKVEGNEFTVLQYATSSELQKENITDIGKACYSISLYATEAVTINQMGSSIFKDHPCHKIFQVEAYLGNSILVDNKRHGTMNFFRMEPYTFSDADRTFLQLLGQFVENAIERDIWQKKVKTNTDEVSWLNKIKIGRELRMIELKREVASLKSKISKQNTNEKT